jgi:LysM repeat protein
MPINKFTKMAVVPAAAVGVALSGWAIADATASHASSPAITNRALTQTAQHRSGQHAGKADAKAAQAARAKQNSLDAAKKARAKRAARRRAQHWVTVRPGQSLSAIADAHHMTWKAVYATPPNYKHVKDPNNLRAGQRLRLPDKPKMRAAEFAKRFGAVERRMQADARQSQAPSSSTGSTGSAAAPSGGSITAGMSAFERCVAWRESSNTPTDPDVLFGILPSTWHSLGYSGMAGQASVAVQEQAFNKLYAMYGTSPWAPYDGC